MTRLGVGDIIEWQGCPVVLLGPNNEINRMRAAYLTTKYPISIVKAGQVLPGFNIEWKQLWTKPLTDQQLALYTRLMLMEAN